MNRLATILLTNGRFDLFVRTVTALRYTELPADWLLDITLISNGVFSGDLDNLAQYWERGVVDRVMFNSSDIGIAAAWNQGWGIVNAIDTFNCLRAPDMVCLLQDDALLTPDWFTETLAAFAAWPDLVLLSGYNSPHHPTLERRRVGGLQCYTKATLPGLHLVGRPSFWENVFPIEVFSHHTDEDWWISRDCAGAPAAIGKVCGVIPGTCTHIGNNRSTWNPKIVREYTDPIGEIE